MPGGETDLKVYVANSPAGPWTNPQLVTISGVNALLAIDPHSPPEFRCNQIVRNIDAFYDAFGVSEGDELWLDNAARVSIW